MKQASKLQNSTRVQQSFLVIKILLLKEKNGKCSMPGGWVDGMQTVKSNTVKEVWEKAGLDVEAVRMIAMKDRHQHNQPPLQYI